MSQIPVRRALVSAYDKTGLEELGRGLAAAGVEVVSTGSTAQRLRDAGVAVTAVDELTGFPECLDGRVKTLHPNVHAGVLADRRLPDHVQQLADLGIEPFDLVVVNLYPFAATVASGASPDECVEQIDIGGPTMVRAAAKNHPSVAVVVDPASYGEVLEAVQAGGFTLEQRRRLAALAFRHTADYDVAVASWFASAYDASDAEEGFPAWLGGSWQRSAVLRYGENPHQGAALYVGATAGDSLATAEQLHGKAMSYNNYVDTDAALRAAHDHADPCVAIIKHANPCGIAVGADVAEAHRRGARLRPGVGVRRGHRGQPAGLGRDGRAGGRRVHRGRGRAGVRGRRRRGAVAQAVDPGAAHERARRDGRRAAADQRRRAAAACRRPVGARRRRPRAGPSPPASRLEDLSDLLFAWRAVRAVKSNAILLAAGGATVGVGMGQVNRVDSARLAVARAGERAAGSVAASDAFFPFADGLQVLLDAGVTAVVQPGGSVRDEEVVAAARAAGVTMYLTGTRHFAH